MLKSTKRNERVFPDALLLTSTNSTKRVRTTLVPPTNALPSIRRFNIATVGNFRSREIYSKSKNILHSTPVHVLCSIATSLSSPHSQQVFLYGVSNGISVPEHARRQPHNAAATQEPSQLLSHPGEKSHDNAARDPATSKQSQALPTILQGRCGANSIPLYPIHPASWRHALTCVLYSPLA